ncbi:MAG: glycine zipper domain-containing protein [Gemmatimonadales bacterium]
MRNVLAAFCVLTIAACGGGDKSDAAIADSLSRDLQLAQQDSTNPMADTAATPANAPATATTPATAKPKTTTPKPTPKPVAPAPAPELAAGTTFSATVSDTVSSRTTQSGAMMQAKVGADVMSADGRLVIPAGSTVNIRLDQFKSAPTKGGKETFSASLVSVIIDGTSYPISGKVDHLDYTLKGRGITAGTAGKVGAGAAAGAVLGKVIGGNSKGAVIGGVVGAAGGAAVANETGDQDITVLPGAQVSMTVTEAFAAR